MKELFEKQKKFNDLVIENLCKRSGMDIKHSQFINEDMLAVMVELGEFIAEKDHNLKKIEFSDILSFLMSCGLALNIDKCVSKQNIIILYAQAEESIYADAILNFNVVFSEFCNGLQIQKYWKSKKKPRNDIKQCYSNCFIALFGIAKTMDYMIQDIMAAYEIKNKINIERQSTNY